MRLLQPVKARLERAWPIASLRTYLFAVMLLATLPMAVLMSLQSFADIRSEQQQIEAQLSQSAAALAEGVERQLRSSLDGLGVLAQSELFQHGRVAALGRLLQGRPRGDWDSVFLLDADGRVVLDTGTARVRASGAEALRQLHRQALAGASAVSGMWERQQPGDRAVAVAVPILQNGRIRSVLGARMGEAVWQRLSASVKLPPGANAAVFDAQDRLLGYSLAPVAPAGATLPADAAAQMKESAAGVHRFSDVDGRTVYAAWRTVPTSGWRVRVALPAAPIDAAHRRSIAAALATSGASLLLGLLLAAFVARRVAHPLRELAARGGTPSSHVPVREIAALRDALQLARAQDAAAHAALAAKAQEFETLFHSSPIGMAFAQDPACRVISHNAAMDALIGAPGSQQAGSVRVLHHGRVLAPGEQPLQRAASRGETTTGLELEIAMEGRPSTFVIANAVPLRDEHGQPRGAVSALADITERKRVEERLHATDAQLRESQRLMGLAQEAGHVGFFHYQFGPDRLAWTPGQCKLFGIGELAQGALADWFGRVAGEDRERLEREFWTACALRRDKETLEYRVLRPDGTMRWLSSRVLVQYDGDGRAAQLIGVSIDVTDQVETERERALLTERALAARAEAEAANRAKDEFLTMLGHELRNPLGAISAASDVLNAAEHGSAPAVEARDIIARQTRNLAHLMNDLLDVGRVIAGKIVLVRQPVNLASVVRRVDQTLAVTGEASEHPLRLRLDDAWCEGDAVRIEQIVTNLLTNAVKYTPAGRPIDVRVSRQDAMAVLEVQDAGMGIPPALLARVFDLFVQGPRPLDRAAGGLGIGLTLVRSIVKLHGGTVEVESSDQGSRFTVRLPAIAAPPQHSADTLPPARRRNVLVVEDNDDVLAALRAKLELDGHQVSTAHDGIQGLERLLQLQPEVSIVDIGLPGLTGFELARHARAAGYAGRMIAMSGYGAQRDAREALVAGFDAYLVKPVDRQQLRASLDAE
ncbi:ATP-binding protein [Ramlibacter sp.]|uniref:hybrid sensor histidine kinase/response regulator n=1 Tax=Ramlibacter sp. TaxID=1917967 RepID=UPI002BC971D8|nr:ATP-binding protein [Ramlibacter sp.]HWI81860.1 ATP-binding protein [Ramlibacter sp.]